MYSIDIENKIKSTSIRGRFAFAVFCIEQYLYENNLENECSKTLLKVLWEFTNTDEMDLWDENISDLLPMNVLDDSPSNVYTDYPSLTEEEFNKFKKFYLKLDSSFIEIINETIGIGQGNLYGGTGDYSKVTFEKTIYVYKIANRILRNVPNFDVFVKSKFSESHGWGDNILRDEFVGSTTE